MDCHLCGNEIGKKYATLIGPSQEYVFSACWDCKERITTKGTGYHPSYHDNGPPVSDEIERKKIDEG